MKSRRTFFAFAGLGALFAALAGKAYAQGRFSQGPIDPARIEEHLERMLKHLYVEIDATPEQQKKLAPIVKQAAHDLLPLRERFHEGRRRGIEILSAAAIDRGALEALRGEQLQLAESASRRLTQALADTAEVLSADQRKALAERVQRHHRHGWGRG
jgi:Spy/CpxP family protein refolding chaperone